MKIDNDPMYKDVVKIVNYVYAQLENLPEEEKWETKIKLHSSANSLLFGIAGALGSNGKPSGIEHEWAYVQRQAISLRTMLNFAYQQKFLEADPGIMVKLDSLIEKVEVELKKALKQSEKSAREEDANWERRYKLWKQANEEIDKATK